MYTTFRFSPEKDLILRQYRGFSFEDIINAIENGGLISVESHENIDKYPHQIMLTVRLTDGMYRVPAVPEGGDTLFLKTAYRSRVATKKFTP